MAIGNSKNPENRKAYDGKKIPLFCLRVRERRLQLGRKQSDLADTVGIKTSQVSELEGGRFPNDFDRIIAIIRALETTPDYLFGFREEP